MKPASEWQKEIAYKSAKYPNTDVTTQIVRLIQLDALEAALSAISPVDLRGSGYRAIEEVMREIIPKSKAQNIREFIEEF